ncbi:MAG: HAMP domain-containing protein [Planctomycetes bacterium]|nr:HAMP domain-containing protein [Planctomycetota bacterium]
MKFYRSIRFRLILVYTLLLCLAITAFGIFGYWRTRRDVIKTVDRTLRAEFLGLGGVYHVDKSRLREFAIETDLENQHGRSPWLYFIATTPRGEIVARTQNTPDSGMLVSPEGFQYTLGGRDAVEIVADKLRCLARMVSDSEGNQYVVQIATSLEFQFKTLDNFVKNMIVGGMVFVVVVTLLGWFIVNGVFMRVRRIRRTAERLSAANLTLRLPVRGTEDEIDRLAQTFNRMIQRIRGSVDRVMRFTADASHEIRTPLSSMRSEVEQALEKRRSSDEYERVLASCLEELDKLGGIANNLLALARSDMTARKRAFGDVNLAETLRGVGEIGAALAQQKRIDFQSNVAPSLCVKGDEEQLSRLFTNLVDNAVRYTDQGGDVILSASTKDGRVTVSVTDTGIGIQKDELVRIFDRFYRSERGRSFSPAGSGLGLSLCEAIAKEHKAVIAVESKPGEGSTFTVRFPPREGEVQE